MAGVTSHVDWAWCETMLPAVSRTFALCIRYLPDDLRRTVTLSYLLCRVADTLEDAPELSADLKGELLDLWARSLADPTVDLSPLVASVAGRQDADAVLTGRAAGVVELLHRQDAVVQAALVPWVSEMCRGMAEFSQRPVDVAYRGLDAEADLDRYCYFVAGTVGRLLTALFAAQRPQLPAATVRGLDALSENFGAGLQLVNILADVARDHERGVCYVPESWCRAEGVSSASLLEPEAWPAARRVMVTLAERARTRLAAAREYCLLLPRAQYPLRLFCLIPYFLALRTLRAVHEDPRYPAPGQRVKVGRSVVHRTLVAAKVCAASNHMLRAYSHRLDGAARPSQPARMA